MGGGGGGGGEKPTGKGEGRNRASKQGTNQIPLTLTVLVLLPKYSLASNYCSIKSTCTKLQLSTKISPRILWERAVFTSLPRHCGECLFASLQRVS